MKSATIAACATTVLAVAAIVTLTAAAQEYVLGRERDAAIQFHELATKVNALDVALNARISTLDMRISALEAGQREIRNEMVTRRDFDEAISKLEVLIQKEPTWFSDHWTTSPPLQDK